MIDEEKIDLLVERLIDRTNSANEYILRKMGQSIAKIRKLSQSEAQTLINILKYGGTYEDIVNKLAEYTNLDIKDIEDIFDEFSKQEYSFYKQFYQYRDMPYTPYKKNYILRNQAQALSNIAENEMYNYTRNNVLGYTVTGLDGITRFQGLRETYNTLLEQALLNVGQGTTTFDESMTHILKEVGGSGLKTIRYESGRTMRLDSAIRMHLNGRLTELHNENQKLVGNEFGYDGWEITVHGNPAPDHQEVQGRQFSIEEYDKLQKDGIAKDYKEKEIIIRRNYKTKQGYYHRPIGEMNCRHYAYPIVLGVSEPEYTDEQLQEINDNANETFEFEGKEYSMYEATQLQRALERKIREQKDIHILAKESNNKPLMQEAQTKINLYRTKYGQLSQASGLPIKSKRMAVSGYKRVKVNDDNEEIKVNNKEDLLNKWNEKYKNDNIVVKHILKAEPQLIDKQITQVDNLLNKYNFIKRSVNSDSETNALTMQVSTGDIMGERNYARFFGGHYIEFNEKYFKESDSLIKDVKEKISKGWWQNINTNNYSVYPVTHEFGHLLEFKMVEIIEHANGYKGSIMRGDYMSGDLRIYKEILKKVPDMDKYLSDYGKSQPRFEWFAETFTQMELGKETPLTKALKEYIEEFMGGKYEYFR